MDSLLTIREVAEKLRLSAQTIYKMLKSGDLKGVRVGKQWRFMENDIDEWLRSRSQSTTIPGNDQGG